MIRSWKLARGLAAAALFALLGSFLPRASLASCGDYVIFTGAAHQPLMAGSDAMGDDRAPIHKFPAFPTRCRGPGCSGQPTTPQAPPAPVQIRLRSDTASLPIDNSELLSRHRNSWVLEDATFRAPDVSSSIFHPPRHWPGSAA